MGYSDIPDEAPPKDACGVFGVWAPGEEVAKLTYYGLYALQHRGQEAAGMAVSDGGAVANTGPIAIASSTFTGNNTNRDGGAVFGGGALTVAASTFSGNATYRGNPTPFVTALLKNDGRNFFELKSGDGQRGGLALVYHGPEPTKKPGYVPMQQEGAIVLGTGGDNSNWSTGLFFEGFMTASVTSKATDDAVQANIVAAGYSGLAPTTAG